MKFYVKITAGCIALFALAGCGIQMPSFPKSAAATTPVAAPQQAQVPPSTPSVQANYASDGSECNSRAQSRMSMYDKPDTYPVSAQERQDAYLALYSSCMRDHNWQIAGPVHAPVAVAQAENPASLASLSPAAGGNMGTKTSTVTAGNTIVSSTSVPGATILVIGGNKATNVAQLSSLSPSAGGTLPQNATVVMVQPPQPLPVATPYAYYTPRSAPLPVAVPVAPSQPAKAAYAPTPGGAAQAVPAAPVQGATYAPAYNNSFAPLAPQSSLPSGSAMASDTPATQGFTQQNSNEQLENALEK